MCGFDLLCGSRRADDLFGGSSPKGRLPMLTTSDAMRKSAAMTGLGGCDHKFMRWPALREICLAPLRWVLRTESKTKLRAKSCSLQTADNGSVSDNGQSLYVATRRLDRPTFYVIKRVSVLRPSEYWDRSQG